MMQVDPLLTVREVAAALQVSVPTVYRLTWRGEFPKPLKFGSLSRWPRSEVLAAIEAAGDRRTQ